MLNDKDLEYLNFLGISPYNIPIEQQELTKTKSENYLKGFDDCILNKKPDLSLVDDTEYKTGYLDAYAMKFKSDTGSDNEIFDYEKFIEDNNITK